MSGRFIIEKRLIPTSDSPIKALVLRPVDPIFGFVSRRRLTEGKIGKTPGILWIHGGGYLWGMASMVFISRALPLVKKYGAVIITPDYRLSEKAPYPAAFNDCYRTLLYLFDHSEEFGIDRSQIMVGGESAGGGLAAAVCMAARDRKSVPIAYQMPLYPMLDDRDTITSSHNHEFVWNTVLNHKGWRTYLSALQQDGHPMAGNPQAPVPPTAAPARQTNYQGLPPCYTFIGTREPFYAETLTYIEHLRAAGVEAVCEVFDTGVHAFDMLMPWRKISQIAAEHFEQHYLYAVASYYTNGEAS